MQVSIVIPCFNEVGTIAAVLAAVKAVALPIEREIVVVDDCSTDGTTELLADLAEKDSGLKVVSHEKNQGKGAALRTGFAAAGGEIVLIQDADMECDPNDIPELLSPIITGQADVVFGSRFAPSHEARPVISFRSRLINRFLTNLCNLFTDLDMTDMEVAYKVFRRQVLEQIELTENRFGFEPEFTIKVARLRCPIYEKRISYNPRTKADGKKISWRDGIRAIYVILKYGLICR